MSVSLRDKIINRMAELGIEPKRSLGQNFLISDSVVQRIVKAAEAESFDQLVEVGPGLGALTDELAALNSNITLIEFDRQFSQYWRDKKINVVEMDALKFNWSDFIRSHSSSVLVSNLPYQISSRLVVDLSILKPTVNRMVLMFQKEVAQRILAKPGTADYGLLSVVAQSFWKIDLVLEAGAVDFFPKPNVASRVLKFDYQEPDNEGVSSQSYLDFLKLSFANRRKKLMPKLKKFASLDDLGVLFENLNLPTDVRVERLSKDHLIALYIALNPE